jgi:ferrous iron transport protein B
VAAKEIVVSTIGVLYAEEDAESGALPRKLQSSGDYTPAAALAFLVFVLLYFPCIATIAAIGSEAGWRWAVGALVYNTLVAWGVAWIFYQIGLWLL